MKTAPFPMIFRLVVLGLVVAGLNATVLRPAEPGPSEPPSIAIVRVWTAFRESKSFVRLGEYREDDREPGGAQILRSQPASRDGYYFTVRLRATDGTKAIPDGKIVLNVVAPDAAQPQTYTFPYAVAGARSAQLLVGLTGADWKYGKVMPLAWKIAVVAADGTTLAQRESFLWEKPAGAPP